MSSRPAGASALYAARAGSDKARAAGGADGGAAARGALVVDYRVGRRPEGPVAQRRSRGLIIPWLQVRILPGPPYLTCGVTLRGTLPRGSPCAFRVHRVTRGDSRSPRPAPRRARARTRVQHRQTELAIARLLASLDLRHREAAGRASRAGGCDACGRLGSLVLCPGMSPAPSSEGLDMPMGKWTVVVRERVALP